MANQKDLELFLKGVKAWNEGVENGGAPARLLGGHGSVPSARHRRFPKGPAPVSDQEPLPIDDQVFPSFDLDPEDADADNPHREVELWGGWEGPDLVEDATIEVAGLEGLVDLLLGLPIWRVLAAGGGGHSRTIPLCDGLAQWGK